MDNNFYKRLARAEAMTNSIRADSLEVLNTAYRNAVKSEDAETAAELARKIRNRLLDSSDKEMTLDRLELDASTPTKFISSIAKIFNGEWAKYRQALRDIPQQQGFPFDVKFPAPPTNDKADIENQVHI